MPIKEKTLDLESLKTPVRRLFFPDGPNEGRSVGLELEIWPFRESAQGMNTPIPFYDDKGQGLIQMLKYIEDFVDGLAWDPLPNGTPRFRIADKGFLTFEPGGQLEYSGSPKPTLREAIKEITRVLEDLRCKLKGQGVWFFHSGLNPWHSLSQLGLQLQKDRYINMNNFFKAIGPYGQKMMRLSTSLQVNLDVGNAETAQRRWLAANLLAPIFTALFANSPFVEGRATGAYSYRSLIWQNLDPSRTGFQKGFLSQDYQPCPVEQYFQFALNAFNMSLPDARGRKVFDGRFLSFLNWMENGSNGFFPDMKDWEDHLSTLFPEVRARGFFEIRYLDAQSKVWCPIPGILLTHLLYNKSACEKVIGMLESYRTTLPAMLDVAAHRAMEEPEIGELARRIYRLAIDTAILEGEEPNILELCERFFHLYSSRNRTPAHDLTELNDGALFTPAQYRDFEKGQIDAAGDLLDIICEYS